MKKMNNLILLCLLLILGSCSGGDNNEGVMNPPDSTNDPGNGDNNPPPSAVTYQDDIRLIVQGNCTSCHSNPPTQQAPMSLTTYNEVRNAAENRGLVSRINSSSNPMPPTGRLPAASRQLIEDWVALGFPE